MNKMAFIHEHFGSKGFTENIAYIIKWKAQEQTLKNYTNKDFR